MDNVSQIFTVGEYVVAGGASTQLEKLIPGKTAIIRVFPVRPDRKWSPLGANEQRDLTLQKW